LKLLCERTGVLAIDRKRDTVTVKFTEQAAIDPERLTRFVAQTRGAQFSPGGILKFNLRSTQPEDIIDQLNGLFRELSEETAKVWMEQ
jgi:transcription-repair coupling factor (superfamily II helicase)